MLPRVDLPELILEVTARTGFTEAITHVSGMLNSISAHLLRLQKITEHWDDILCLTGSLKLGQVSAIDIIRTLQVGDRPTRLAQAIAELGRIDKIIHMLNYIYDESTHRKILI